MAHINAGARRDITKNVRRPIVNERPDNATRLGGFERTLRLARRWIKNCTGRLDEESRLREFQTHIAGQVDEVASKLFELFAYARR